MKLNKYSWLAVLPMIFTACQDDTLVENQQQDKIYTLSATMDGDAAMSRAQIQLGNSDANAGEIFFWNEGDSFTLYQEIDGNHSEHIFRINGYSEDGDGDKKLASFVTNNPAAVGSAVAFYPSGLVTDFDDDSKRVSLQLQTTVDFSKGTVEEVWKDYFNNNMLMRAPATLTENNENTLEFEHLLSLARITYQNESGKDQQVTEIKLGGDQTYGYAPTVWLDYGWIGGQFNNGYGITYENLIVKAGESFDFYILFGPEKFADGDMHIHIHTAQTDGNRSPLTLPTSTIAAANDGAEGFEAGKRYWFKVTETEEGLVWSKDYQDKPVVDEMIVIDNIPLSKALYEVYSGQYEMALNSDEKLEIKQSEILKFTEILINWREYDIPTLDGIENFVELTSLGLGSVGLQSCDLSNNTKLRDLNVSWNQLTELDLSNNPNLTTLSCEFNEGLSKLVFSNKAKLSDLNVGNTALTELNIPDPSNINSLRYGKTNIPSMSFEGFNSLTLIDNCGMELENLDYIPDTIKANMTYLSCSDNKISYIDMKKFPNLEYLYCNNNNLTSLDLSIQKSLHSLQCMGNQIDSLDITHTILNSTENSLEVGKQQDGQWLVLTVTDAQKEAWNNGWKDNENNIFVRLYGEEPEETITIDNASFAQELKKQFGDNVILQDGKATMTKSFAENDVTEINIWGNRDVTSLEGIKNFTNLKRLILVYNGLTSLDVSGLTKLEFLECWDGGITSLNVAGCTALKELYCQTNALTELDVTDCINITNLNCENNKLTSLDLSNCTNNEIELYCGNQGQTAGEEITITIKLTDAMKTYWKKFLFDEENNEVRVLIDGDTNPVIAPSIGKENW